MREPTPPNAARIDGRSSLDDRIALLSVLQELTVAVLRLFDPASPLDDFLEKVTARLGCAVTLCVEAGAPGQPLALLGSSGLARSSRALPLPALPARGVEGAAFPYPELRRLPSAPWVARAGGEEVAPRSAWLLLWFEREPQSPLQYRGAVQRLARDLGLALAHREMVVRVVDSERALQRLNDELERRVQDRTAALASANRALNERVRELTALSDLGRTFSSTLKVDELVRVVTRVVGQSLGYQHLALLLLDERQTLVVTAVHGVEADAEGDQISLGEGVAGVAAQEKRLVLVRDTQADGRFRSHRFTKGRAGSLLAVPMVFRGECVGVLDFFRPKVDGFGEEELSFLQSVASQAAMAVSNARLFERTVTLSLTDPLTGLHNRRSLFERLELELERSHRFAHGSAVLMLDVDRFKELNDTLGHPAGDAVLRQMAGLLGGAVRKIDTAARYGGEEFLIILPRADRLAAGQVAEKLRRLVGTTPFRPAANLPERRVTISVGVAVFPEDATDPATLVACADAALLAAKDAGRDRVIAYRPGMRDRHRSPGAQPPPATEAGGTCR